MYERLLTVDLVLSGISSPLRFFGIPSVSSTLVERGETNRSRRLEEFQGEKGPSKTLCECGGSRKRRGLRLTRDSDE